MKKKIVYISGADSFDAAQVRAAFDEVRGTLGLDADTVLFGVPVDDLIAIDTADKDADSVNSPGVAPESIEEVAPAMVDDEVQTVMKEEVITESPVVPILSVLGGKEAEPVAETIVKEVPEIEDLNDVEQILDDEAPVEVHEKTLEELLETMTPLREDAHSETVQETPEPVMQQDSCEDATLASLASEFVDVQDKVPTVKKGTERGKISKLKNILPFKKMKRDDTGIMGDLFGWAGVAANDEDFSIPGFFTNVASKK